MTLAQLASLGRAAQDPVSAAQRIDARELKATVTAAMAESEKRSVEITRSSRVEPKKLHEPFTV